MWQPTGIVKGWIFPAFAVVLMGACSEQASSLAFLSKQDVQARSSSSVVAIAPPRAQQYSRPTFQASQRVAGFSPNGSYYVYLESSRDTGAGVPKLNLQVVEVAKNACVSRGCIETQYGETDAERSIEAIQQDLLEQTWTLRKTLQLTAPVTGTKLPILDRSRMADGTETVTLQLGDRPQPLQLRLRQNRIASAIAGGTAEKDQAAMQLEVFDGRESRSLSSLDNFRDWILDYSIREVYLSPNGKSVVVLLTATKPTFEGTIATTLIQSFELQ